MTTAIKINPDDGKVTINATGGETQLNFDFPIFDATHLKVVETNLLGVASTLTKDVDYTVPAGSVNAQNGGPINLTAASYPSGATNGHKFTLLLNVPEGRTTDFQVAGDFFTEALNKELDLIVQFQQQFARDLALAPHLPDSTSLVSFLIDDVSSATDGMALFWNNTSLKGEWKAIQAAGTFVNPMTTTGDLIKRGSGGTPARQAMGSANTVLQVNAGGTDWETGLVDTANLAAGAVTGSVIADSDISPKKFNMPTASLGRPPDLKVETKFGATSTTMDISWAVPGMVLHSDASGLEYIQKGDVEAAITASGINGLDTGSEAADTWYHVWVVLNPTPASSGTTDATTASKLEDSTADFVTDGVKIGDIVRNTTDNTETYVTAVDDLNTLSLNEDIFVSGEGYQVLPFGALLSTSSTSPTMPAGYVYKRRVGVVRNNASSNFIAFRKKGTMAQYEAEQQVLTNGSATSNTTIALTGFLPPTAHAGHFNYQVEWDHSTPDVEFNIRFRNTPTYSTDIFHKTYSQVANIRVALGGSFTFFFGSTSTLQYVLNATGSTSTDADVFMIGYEEEI